VKSVLVAALVMIVSVVPIPSTKLIPFAEDFRAVAGLRWLDRAAQVKAESNFKPKVTAIDGGMGLGQFMPGTWKFAVEQGWVLAGESPYDVRPNLTAQHRYMLYLEARTQTWPAALGSYNAGLGSIRKAQRLAEAVGISSPDAWLQTLPRVTGINKFTGKPNADITRAYVTRIRNYRAQYGKERGE